MQRREGEASTVSGFTAHVEAVAARMRLAILLAAGAYAAGAALAVLIAMMAAGTGRRAAWPLSSAAAVAVLATLAVTARRSWTPAAAARQLERAHPESRNVIVTAEELLRNPDAARDVVRARVVRDALAAARGVEPARAVPLGRPARLFVLAMAAWGTGAAWLTPVAAPVTRDAPPPSGVARVADRTAPLRILATLVPPDYLEAGVRRLENPERIEAVAGTRLEVALDGAGGRWRIRLGPANLETVRTPAGITAETTLVESSYLAIEEVAGRADGRRLIPVIVTPDRAPAIRIERPGRDLRLPESSGTIRVAAAATDDFGLSSLELRYTKVSGSGEQFEFEEGVIPLQLDRESARAWTGRAALDLSNLQLQPGDALVYRAVGADRRPAGAGAASSDTFVVEIAGPEQVTLAGFELPPDRERHALSQHMILLKIQRLRAREAGMSREAVTEEAEAIAVEQRSVRANFIFLTGGHVEDEEEEAEHSHEIQEGRLEHGARREIAAAIGHMSRAEQALIAVDPRAANPPARAAVEALQRAFARNRYFLRTLPVRSRLDPSRRLSGDLGEAADSRRTLAEPEASPAVSAAREILAQLLDAAAGDPQRLDAGRLTALAERALAADSASEPWQEIAAALLKLRDSAAGAGPDEVDTLLADLIGKVRAEAGRGAIPPVPADPRGRTLNGAWAGEAVRR